MDRFDKKVLLFLIMTVLMHLSSSQNPRQLIRFGKRPFSNNRYRSQLAYLKFPKDAYKTRIGYPDESDATNAVQQPLDFQHTDDVNDLRIRKWAADGELQDLLEH